MVLHGMISLWIRQEQTKLLKEVATNLDMAKLDAIIEKTKSKRFDPASLATELEALVAELK
jgi:hypothetical protein